MNAMTISIISIGISVFLLIIVIMQGRRLNDLREKYTLFLNGSEPVSIENLMISYSEKLNKLEDYTNLELTDRVEELDRKMENCFQKYGIVRYNAFGTMGNNMSFSIALLDNNKTGFILTGIYSAEYAYCYAKDVVKGEAQSELSDEEKEALNTALDKFRNFKKNIKR